MKKTVILILLILTCAGIACAAGCKKKNKETDPTGAGANLTLASDGTVAFLQDKDLTEDGKVFYYRVLGEEKEFIYNKWEKSNYEEEDKKYRLSFDLNDFADYAPGDIFRLSVVRHSAYLGGLNMMSHIKPYIRKLYEKDAEWELFFTVDESGAFCLADDYLKDKAEEITTLYPLGGVYARYARPLSGNMFRISQKDGTVREMPLPMSFLSQIDTSKEGEGQATFSLGGVTFSHDYRVIEPQTREEGGGFVYTSVQTGGAGELTLAEDKGEDGAMLGMDAAALESLRSLEKLTVPFALKAGDLAGFDSLKELTVSAKSARLSELFGGKVPDSLKTVYLWDDCDNFPAYFLHGGAGVEKLVVPASFTAFEENAFSGLDGVTEAVVAGAAPARELPSVQDVRVAYGSEATGARFLSAKAVRRVWFPDTVRTLGEHALSSCGWLESVRFSNATVTVGERALYATTLTRIDLPLNVRTIGQYAMSKNFSVTEITTGKRVENIDQHAFHDCRVLKTLKIPSPSVRYQDVGMLQYTDVRELWIGGGQPIRWLYGKPEKGEEDTELQMPYRLEKLRIYGDVCDNFALGTYRTFKVELDDSVKKLGEHAFASCGIFSSIDLNRVEEIGKHAFWENRRCTEVTATDALRHIDKYAFFASGYIARAAEGPLVLGDGFLVQMRVPANGVAVVPDGVKRICHDAFGSGLIECDIPASVEWIDGDAFFGQEALIKITLRGRAALGGKPFETSPEIEEIYVNISDLDYYRDSEYWKSFASLVKPL